MNKYIKKLNPKELMIRHYLIMVLLTALISSSLQAQKYMFISSEVTDGSISEQGLVGVEAADAICKRLAMESTILPTDSKDAPWMAWISDSLGATPLSRFTLSTTEYRLPDSTTVIANDFADLTDGTIGNLINQDENANLVSDVKPYTATYADGTPDWRNCTNWTALDTGAGQGGDNNHVDGSWSSAWVTACGAMRPLYCVQQEDLSLYIGGNVTGLAAGNTVVLQNNAGDDLTITSNGVFTFDTPLDDRSDYQVSVLTQPVNPDQTCVIRNGSGNLVGNDITDVNVQCATVIPGQKYFFISSEVTDGSISEQGLVGVEAADAICKRLAMASTILPADSKAAPWMAWLSDSLGTTPLSRFTVSASDYRLPDAATVIANDFVDLFDGYILNLINQDENANLVSNVKPYTATREDGTADFRNCSNWTATDNVGGLMGDNSQTDRLWTAGWTTACGAQNPLYCVQQEDLSLTVGGNVTGLTAGNTVVLQNNAGDDLAITANGSFTFDTPLADRSDYFVSVLTQPTSPDQICVVRNGSGNLMSQNITDVDIKCSTVLPGQKYMFISSERTDGSISEGGLTGVEAADAICKRLAMASTILPDEAKAAPWMAWISDGLGSTPLSRFTLSTTDYRLPDSSTIVASSLADLTDGTLTNTITRDENDNDMLYSSAYTATNADGSADFRNCNNWTSTEEGGGIIGDNHKVNRLWTSAWVTHCSSINSLYCVQQEDLSLTIGGDVTGLAVGNTVVIQNNAGDDLAITANGSFTFDTPLDDRSDYHVTVLSQPTDPDQTCVVFNGSGNLVGNHINDIIVQCATVIPEQKYVFTSSETTDGSISEQGLIGIEAADAICKRLAMASTVLPADAKAAPWMAWLSDSVGNSPSTRFSQSSTDYRLPDGATVVASSFADLTDTVLTNPINQDENGNVMTTSSVHTGTRSSGASDSRNCSGWTVTDASASLIGYNDRIYNSWTQQAGVSCLSNYHLYCFQQEIQRYTVGGQVTGLAAGNSVVLQNNSADDLVITANDNFSFGSALEDGSVYQVSVLTQPTTPNQSCVVTNESGNLAGSNVNDVNVECTTLTHTIAGSISGLAPGNSIVIQNNSADDLTLTANGGFAFNTALDDGSGYNITVLTPPTTPNQDCEIPNGFGILSGSDVTDITIECTTLTYNVGGFISGLSEGNVVELQNNSEDDLAVIANGEFTFETALYDESEYSVSVLTQPTMPNQNCVIANESGNLAGNNVTDVNVECTTLTYTIGGIIIGLTDGNTVVLQNNLTDDLTVISNGDFTFDTHLNDGSDYNVTVLTQPTSPNQFCETSYGSGSLAGSGVTSVFVNCLDLDTIFINSFEIIFSANKSAYELIKFIKQLKVNDEYSTPQFQAHNSVYMFYGEQLSRDKDGLPRKIEDVMFWFETILVEFNPAGDWDNDGIVNADDLDPFGI